MSAIETKLFKMFHNEETACWVMVSPFDDMCVYHNSETGTNVHYLPHFLDNKLDIEMAVDAELLARVKDFLYEQNDECPEDERCTLQELCIDQTLAANHVCDTCTLADCRFYDPESKSYR